MIKLFLNYFRGSYRKPRQEVLGLLPTRISTELFSGSGESPPLPSTGKGAHTGKALFRNKFQWNYFGGSRGNFWQEPRGAYRMKLLSNYLGNHFAGGCQVVKRFPLHVLTYDSCSLQCKPSTWLTNQVDKLPKLMVSN